MAAMDFIIDGTRVDRLTAVKKVLTDFVEGGDELGGRPDDLVGLVAFAKYADTASPLTLDHAHVINALNAVRIATDRAEDGTAIGDAMALAVERLRELEERGDDAGRKIKSKVIVLLTDGENNSGDIDPIVAAEIAAAFDVKLYAIGVGSNGAAPIQVRDALGRMRMHRVPVSIDEDTLREMAAVTGGRYFRATDTDSLRDIYEAIDEMEKTTTEHRRYKLYSDLAVKSLRVRGFDLPPLLLVALLFLGIEQLLVHTRFRTLP
jgi:Ca-activated chloride channel family protein